MKIQYPLRSSVAAAVSLLLCVSASQAALPPLPVPRPVQRFSPRHASQPKTVPMLKLVTISPASELPPPMAVTVTTNINFMGCEPMDPSCVMYFNQNVAVEQPAGSELTLYMKDTVNATGGHKLAWFGAASFARKSEFTWYQPMNQFPSARFFYYMKVYPVVAASRTTAAPVIWVDPALKFASAKSVKK